MKHIRILVRLELYTQSRVSHIAVIDRCKVGFPVVNNAALKFPRGTELVENKGHRVLAIDCPCVGEVFVYDVRWPVDMRRIDRVVVIIRPLRGGRPDLTKYQRSVMKETWAATRV